jgi:6,7-dimethyl-8-ribityllumazine synthase
MAGRAPRLHRRERPGQYPRNARFAIVAARFNERIVKRLLSGALRALSSAGLPDDAVDVHWVPGSFELPQAASCLARTGRYSAIVCVGCVIKGETPHFDFVAGQAAAGIQRVALDTGVPATFGLITALTEEQAWARAGGDVGNRGQEAAAAALEMAAFLLDNGARRGKLSDGRNPHLRAGRGLRHRRAQADSQPDRRGRSAKPLGAAPEASRQRSALRSRPGGK